MKGKLLNVPGQRLVGEGAGGRLHEFCCLVLLSVCFPLTLQKVSEMYSVEHDAFYLRKRQLQTMQGRLQGRIAGIG